MQVLNFYALGKKIPENAVYIGRTSAKHGLEGSIYANPFPMRTEAERPQVIQKYRRWLAEQVSRGEITKQQLAELHGKDFVCYCAPKACHGDVLKSAVEWAVRDMATPGRETKAPRPGA